MIAFNHSPSLVMTAAVVHSTLVERRVIVASFLVHHEVAPPTNRNTQSNVDREVYLIEI